MYLELILFVLLGLFILLFVSTAFLEKQRIHEFVPASPGQEPASSPYFVAMNAAARDLGFVPAGVFFQNRNSRVYQACIAIWVSATGETLLRVSGGKTAGVPIKRTMLISFVEPDRILETCDDFGMTDLSGLTERNLVLNGDLVELWDRHQERLIASTGQKRPFSPAEALAACESMQAMKARQMQKLGLGKFLNADRTIWRHTLKGAVQSYFIGFRSQLAAGKEQKERIKRKRPGQQ